MVGSTPTWLTSIPRSVIHLPPPPIWDGKGNLFGATTDGGIRQPACWTGEGCGVIFEMTPNRNGTWTYHILHHFASYPADGETPYGGLVLDAFGNFYGSTELGGVKGNGTVFKLAFTHSHWKKTAEAFFSRGAGKLGLRRGRSGKTGYAYRMSPRTINIDQGAGLAHETKDSQQDRANGA
jgi:hypothetical protein